MSVPNQKKAEVQRRRAESIARTVEAKSLKIYTPEEIAAFAAERGEQAASGNVLAKAYRAATEQR